MTISPPNKQEAPRSNEAKGLVTLEHGSRVWAVPLELSQDLERELAEEKAMVERMMDAEQERLLLASEDEIRKEILARGRDPDEYLKAVDTVMKLSGENAILKQDLQKALANHSADLSAREESPVTPEQFTDLLKRIAVRMGGHTIPVVHGPAWHNFMGLLRQVTPYECGIGPMPSEGNSPYVAEKP